MRNTAWRWRCPSCFSTKEQEQAFVHPAQLPNGENILLLKTLLTSACERDCFYCLFRAGRDFLRATFKPDEFANLFSKLTLSGAAEGTFLSSGVTGGGVDRQKINRLNTADILRKQARFSRLHRSVTNLCPCGTGEGPGISGDCNWQNRVLDQTLRRRVRSRSVASPLDTSNSMDELLQPLKWIGEIRQNPFRHIRVGLVAWPSLG